MAAPLTPLLPYYEGLATVGLWYTYTIPTDMQITNYRMEARAAPTGSNLTVEIRKNGVSQQVVTLTAGSLDTGNNTVALSFSAGDTLVLQVTAIGSTLPGSGLQMILDISATNLTQVAVTQTPYTIIQEGNLSIADVFTYTFNRSVTLSNIRFQVRTAPQGASAVVKAYKNGTIVATSTITTGNVDSGNQAVSINYFPGDVLLLSVTAIGTTVVGAGLIVSLDYTLNDLIPNITGQFYSDPDTDVIFYLRQIGIGNAQADSAATSDLTRYKQRANEIIDSALTSTYRTPLFTITRNLRTYYPEPIGMIAQRIVGWLLVNDMFSEIEPAASSNSERDYKMAIDLLETVAERRTTLKGQRYRSRSMGSNPYTEPMAPFTPAPPMAPGGTA